jgi:hypothetical protein
MARRLRPLRRRAPLFRQRERLLVVCEGRVSEPEYFEELRNFAKNPLVVLKIVPNAGATKMLVEHAIREMEKAEGEARRCSDPYRRYDQVWCVFDVDNHGGLKQAVRLANTHGLKLAISNPRFELWLLLHFVAHSADRNGHTVQRILTKHLPGYDKHINFSKLVAGYPDAVRRARQLDSMHKTRGTAGGNPSTGVYVLTGVIVRPPRTR